MFDQAEAGTLTPLPAAAFTLAEWSRAKVGTDVNVKCGKALYSVPWRLIGQLVDIRATHACQTPSQQTVTAGRQRLAPAHAELSAPKR